MAEHRIRLAVIGAGIFARDDHLPALMSLPDDFEVAAVWSRSQESASRLAERYAGVEPTTDYDALLGRDDIDAVDIILPINALPEAIEKALRAGKHVVSEKPMAPNVAEGRRLLQIPRDRVWMVAENWRYSPGFRQAAAIVRSGELGRVLLIDWVIPIDMNPNNKYYTTPWRRADDFLGGFLLDGGVHHVAVFRLLAGEINSVMAHSAQARPDLPPLDVLTASLRFDSGTLAGYSVTFAAPSGGRDRIQVVGDRGFMTVERGSIAVSRDGQARSLRFPDGGVVEELHAFAQAIRGEPHLNTPEEALQDVAVIEALVESANTGQRVTPARVI